MALREDQLSRLSEAGKSNALKGRYVADHMMVGSSEAPEEAADKTWLAYLSDMSTDMADNARVMLNAGTRSAVAFSRSMLVLSSEGFASDIKVNYMFLNPGSYMPWISDVARDVKQVVLHSFGQQWHAFEASSMWQGYMNPTSERVGGAAALEYYATSEQLKPTIVWVPQGTAPYRGMAHPVRIATALRSLVTSAEGTVGVHFIIDREGNLYVMSDCNNILRSSGVLSDTCVSIALEEALYADSLSAGGHPIPYTWYPDGSGNLTAWDFSDFQYNTLAALIAKLRLAYPNLRTSNYSTSRNSVDRSFVGYTMHGHVADAKADHIDVAPHFATSEKWEQFFALVDGQSQMTKVPVWQKIEKGYKGRLAWVTEITKTMGTDSLGFNKQATINPSIPILAGAYRAQLEACKTSAYYAEKSARYSVNESQLQSMRQSVGTELESIARSPLVLPASEPIPADQSVDDQRHSGQGDEGLFG